MLTESSLYPKRRPDLVRRVGFDAGQWRILQRLVASGLFVLVVAALWKVRPMNRNLALSGKASSSSQAFGTTAQGAFDGLVHGQLGFHSGQEQGPWLMVDLGAVIRLERIEVYGRGDCCYEQSLPVVLEVSVDAAYFSEIDRRKVPFGQVNPWEVGGNGTRARYVRVRSDKYGYLVISELEVFGEIER